MLARSMGPGRCKSRVEPDRFLECLNRVSRVGLQGIDPALKGESAQIGVVGGGIVGWPLRQRLLLCAGKLGVQLLGDGARHFTFDPEDVIQRAVVTFGPDMVVGGGADELHIDVHRVRHFLHASFENVCHAELPCDFSKVLRTACVMRSRSARDHFETADLGQSRQNFVLNTFGEVSVGLIIAEVLEGKHSDTSFWDSRDGSGRSMQHEEERSDDGREQESGRGN